MGGGKALITSKTFWANIINLGLQVALAIPPKYGIPATTLMNLILRYVTDQPITGLIRAS